MNKKTVYLHDPGDPQLAAALTAMLAALECVELTDDVTHAAVQVVAIAPAGPQPSTSQLMAAAADRGVRVIGVRVAPGLAVPDVLALTARRIVATEGDELHDAICNDAPAPSGGGGGFPPRPHPCGSRR